MSNRKDSSEPSTLHSNEKSDDEKRERERNQKLLEYWIGCVGPKLSAPIDEVAH